MAMTAASRTAEWLIKAFSRSTELIHSPPDLIRSLERSTSLMQPSGSIMATSPVRNQPSLLQRSLVSGALKLRACYPGAAHFEFTRSLAIVWRFAVGRHDAQLH